MSLPTCIDFAAFQNALLGLGFRGDPQIVSLAVANPRHGDDPDDFAYAVDAVTLDGQTHRIPLVILPNGKAYT